MCHLGVALVMQWAAIKNSQKSRQPFSSLAEYFQTNQNQNATSSNAEKMMFAMLDPWSGIFGKRPVIMVSTWKRSRPRLIFKMHLVSGQSPPRAVLEKISETLLDLLLCVTCVRPATRQSSGKQEIHWSNVCNVGSEWVVCVKVLKTSVVGDQIGFVVPTSKRRHLHLSRLDQDSLL